MKKIAKINTFFIQHSPEIAKIINREIEQMKIPKFDTRENLYQ